jgi:uroporphyrinogen-III synthase
MVTIELMSFTSPIETRPLYGHRVLVPRGGPWGDAVASALRAKGAAAVIAPMINFSVTDDQPALEAALAELSAGSFDWVTLVSATTVDVLMAHGATIPATTKVAAVGETTAAALASAGYKADLVPSEDNTAKGLLEQWTAATGGVIPLKVLTLRSQDVHSVVAYKTVGVPVADVVVADVKNAKFNVILVTSGSVARQVAEQFGEIPVQTTVVAIGPRTAKDAKALGLRIDVIAETPEPQSLVELLLTQVYG